MAAGAHGEVGAEAETERESATAGGDPSGKEATVARDPAWRREGGAADEKKDRATAVVGMVVDRWRSPATDGDRVAVGFGVSAGSRK